MNIQILNSRYIEDLLKKKTIDSLAEYYILCKVFFFNIPNENDSPKNNCIYQYIIKDNYYRIVYKYDNKSIKIELLNLFNETTKL